MLTKKNRVWAIAALFGGILGLSACLKSGDNIIPRPPFYVAFINAATTPSSMDIFQDNKKLNNTAPFPMGAGSVLPVPVAGTYAFSFRNINGVGLDSVTRQFDSLQAYTIITYNQGGGTFRSLLQKEDLSNTSNQKINFRFLNLSTNTPAVDLYFNDVKVDSNRTYGFSASWININPALDAYTYKVKLAGTDSVIARGGDGTPAQLSTMDVYTFFLTGLAGSTDNATKLKISYTRHYLR
ncbi:MAG TPA: DUF4397 domain-containing protein [Chitinophaga sp.]|uniref:DUF4397 domain-containing protein n=1 Tax=Chitinophaga sp. TaxID=1869181 RepID=UPI002B77CC6F|nr:DUF4397 domain-containing protein [Chitinophaga sp.]HVI44367.1 DUF4397 domain-containing protein [Chitinophaga sp.]